MTRDEYYDIKMNEQKLNDMAKRSIKTIVNIYSESSLGTLSECREYLETYCLIRQAIKELF